MSTVFRVEKNANYTVMSNIHLKDRRLSLKAKGLLSVILSLPPEWDYTVTGLARIVADGADSVRTAVRELESFGYITRRQSRDEIGRMSANEYHVYEDPKQNPDFVNENNEKNSESEKADNIFLASPSAGEPSKENPSTGKPSTNTFNILNTNKSNTHSSITHLRAAREKEDLTEELTEELTEGKNDFLEENYFENERNEREEYLNTIHENIDYDNFADKAKADEVVNIMLDVMCSQKGTIRVNGEELPVEQVRKRFLELKKTHIEHALNALESNAGNVRNIRAYLITALYNAPNAVYSTPPAHNNARSAPNNAAHNNAYSSPHSTSPNSAYSSRSSATTAKPYASASYDTGSSFDVDDVFARIKARYKQPREADPWYNQD